MLLLECSASAPVHMLECWLFRLCGGRWRKNSFSMVFHGVPWHWWDSLFHLNHAFCAASYDIAVLVLRCRTVHMFFAHFVLDHWVGQHEAFLWLHFLQEHTSDSRWLHTKRDIKLVSLSWFIMIYHCIMWLLDLTLATCRWRCCTTRQHLPANSRLIMERSRDSMRRTPRRQPSLFLESGNVPSRSCIVVSSQIPTWSTCTHISRICLCIYSNIM